MDTYVNVDIYIEDIISEIGDEELLNECISRELLKNQKIELTDKELKEFLCDRYLINHLSDWNLILDKLKKEFL